MSEAIVEIALSGYKVVTTFHTEDSVQALLRMEAPQKITTQDIEQLKERLRSLDRDIESGLDKHEVGSLLTTIDGIGSGTAARLIAEEGCDYAQAKRRAVHELVGDQRTSAVPDNAEVEREAYALAARIFAHSGWASVCSTPQTSEST
mgnify:CR=1 FL=1